MYKNLHNVPVSQRAIGTNFKFYLLVIWFRCVTYFNNGEKCFLICPHHRECFLATSSENPFHSGNTHAINNISCKPERNLKQLDDKMTKWTVLDWYTPLFKWIISYQKKKKKYEPALVSWASSLVQRQHQDQCEQLLPWLDQLRYS